MVECSNIDFVADYTVKCLNFCNKNMALDVITNDLTLCKMFSHCFLLGMHDLLMCFRFYPSFYDLLLHNQMSFEYCERLIDCCDEKSEHSCKSAA